MSKATAPLAEALVGYTNGSRPGTQTVDLDGVDGTDTADDSTDVDDASIVPVEMVGDGPLVVREKSHKAGPMSIDQALFAMELVGHDFYLFRDTATDKPSVVYRRRGYDYGVIRLEEPAERGS